MVIRPLRAFKISDIAVANSAQALLLALVSGLLGLESIVLLTTGSIASLAVVTAGCLIKARNCVDLVVGG